MIIRNGIHYYERENTDKEGFAVIPSGEVGSAIMIVVHGIGEIGAGLYDNLLNLTEGMDLDNNPATPRQYALATPEFKKNLADTKTIGVVVNYTNQGLTPSDFVYIINTVVNDFKADRNRIGLICFSLGGQQVIPFITSSLENAQRIVLAVLCAPVNPGGNWKNVVDAKVQVIGTTVAVDKRVDASNVRRAIADINKLNPTIAPVYIEWPGEAHGTFNEMLACTDPRIPMNIFTYLNSASAGNRKQYPATGTTKPTDPGPVTPIGTLKAVASFTGEGPSFSLSGRESTGYRYQTWTVTKTPDGVSPYSPMINGAGNIVAGFKAPAKGDYEIEFKVYDSTDAKTAKTDTVTLKINYGGAVSTPRKLTEATGSIVLKYSDGTTGLAKVSVKDGKLIVEE